MNDEIQSRRLFVPLASAPFEWFRSGKKSWELRRHGRQFTEKHVIPGRAVELRKGYQTTEDVIWGTVKRTLSAGSLADFFDQVPYQLVVPNAESRSQAVDIATSILGIGEHQPALLLGFEIEFDR